MENVHSHGNPQQQSKYNPQLLTVVFKCQKIVQNSHNLSELYGLHKCIIYLYIYLDIYIYLK